MGKFSIGSIKEQNNEKFSPEFIILAIFLVGELLLEWMLQLFAPEYNKSTATNFISQISLAITLGILVIFQLSKLLKKEKSFQISIADICLIGLAVVGILSTLHAADKIKALYGAEYRNEGIYVLLCYYGLFFTASCIRKQQEKKKILLLIGAIGAFGTFMGVLAGQGCLNALTESWPNRAAMPYGNPNFYGAFSCMAMACAMGLYLYGETKKIRIFGIISFALATLAIFSCDSTSPIVGNIMVFLAVLVVELYIWIKGKDKTKLKKRLCRLGISFLLYIVCVFSINATRKGSVFKEFMANVSYTEDGLTGDMMFSSRMGVWKYAISRVPDYWYLGIGVDNFQVLTNEEGMTERWFDFDKAHNEYLQILLTEGIFSLLFYLVLLFVLFFQGLKRWKKEENLSLVVPLFLIFFGYIAQAFFNIRTIEVAPFFWISCGLLYERKW